MNEADATALIATYAESHYHPRSAAGWFDASEAGRPIGGRAVAGSKVPVARAGALLGAMLENVEEARRDLKATADRMRQAKDDGLLDVDAMAGLDKKIQRAWIAAVELVRGDYARAVSELKHWQEYAERASAGELPTLSDTAARGENLIRGLANRLSVLHDDPAVATDDEKNAAVNRIAADLERWRASQPVEPDRRLPPEPDDDEVPF